MTHSPHDGPDRRTFLKTSSAALIGAAALPRIGVHSGTSETLRIALIGCGGRGTGALAQALQADPDLKLVALGDAFQDRVERCRQHIQSDEVGAGDRAAVDDEHCFVGFDAYQKVLACDVDVVLLATPPHFRPAHFEAAIAANKHVFMEKPVAVDGFGVRQVLAAAELATKQNRVVGVGLQRHHQNGYVETMKRVHDGAIGEILAARAYWDMGSLWMHPRQPEWSDMEWQMRNWLYFTWLSGDHIVEQHIHNLDVVNWAKGKHPIRAHGMGGRQVRTEPAFGHIFDHHAVHFEYDDGAWMFSQCRQIPQCHNQVSEHLIGSEGQADFEGGYHLRYRGKKADWKYDGENNNPYQTEHDALFAAIRAGTPHNEARHGAESTLTAIMGRMATYSGKLITWEDALNSERLGPKEYAWGDLPVPPVPMPGQ